jgi:hypothetical protein
MRQLVAASAAILDEERLAAMRIASGRRRGMRPDALPIIDPIDERARDHEPYDGQGGQASGRVPHRDSLKC